MWQKTPGLRGQDMQDSGPWQPKRNLYSLLLLARAIAKSSKAQDFLHVGQIATGLEALVFDPQLCAGIPPQERVGRAPQDGHVAGSMALAQAAFVFPEGHVQHPVQGVFDAPVPADVGQQGLGVRGTAGNEMADADSLLRLRCGGGIPLRSDCADRATGPRHSRRPESRGRPWPGSGGSRCDRARR